MPEFLVLRYSTIYDFQAKAVGDHCKQAKTGRTKTTANTGHFECSCGSFTLICGRPSPAGESSIPGDQLREGIFDSRDPAIRGRPDNRRLGEHKQACKAPLSAAIQAISALPSHVSLQINALTAKLSGISNTLAEISRLLSAPNTILSSSIKNSII